MKQFVKRIMAALLAGSLLVCCLAGCGQKNPARADSEEPVTLTFWHTYSEGEEKVFLEKVVPGFEKANPGIKIDAIRMPLDGLQQQIITSSSGDAAPDVMRIDNTWVAEFAKLGALQDVSGFEDFDAVKADMMDAPMATNYYNEGYYGIGLDTTTTVAVWNMDMLKQYGITEPPTTMEGLVAMAKEHNDSANEKWAFTIAGTYTWAMLPYFWGLGGELTDESFTAATGYLNSDASVNALDTIAQWYKDGIISHAIIGEQPDAWGGMTGGQYAMISEGPWFFSSNDTDFECRTTVMPAGAGGSVSIVGGQDVVMSSNCKNQDAAWKFMKYLASEEAQLAMAEAGMIPVTRSAVEKMNISETPYLEAYLDQLETAKPRTPSANWGQIDTLLGNAFEKAIRGEVSAKDALNQAAAEVDKLLK